MKAIIKGEFFRLFKSKSYFILFGIVAIIMICIVCDYNNQFYYQNGYNGYGIVRYDIDELPQLISEYEQALSEDERRLEGNLTTIERENLINQIDGIQTQLNVYRYLYEHDIPYNEYRDFAGMRNYYGDNAISAFTTFCERLTSVLPFCLSIFAIWMIAWDYFRGTYKFLYSTQTPRIKIMAGRYLTWLIISATCVLLVCTVAMCLGFLFGGAGGIVIFANASGAFGLNTFGIFCFEFVDILFRTLIIGSICFGFSLLVRNILIPVLPSAVMFIGSFFAYASSEISTFLSVLLGGFQFAFIMGGMQTLYILYAILMGVTFALACLLCGTAGFLKRDLK